MFLTCTSLSHPPTHKHQQSLLVQLKDEVVVGFSFCDLQNALLIKTKIFVLSSLMHVSSGLVKTEQSFTVFYLFNLFLQVPDSRFPAVLPDEQTEGIR